MDVAFIGIVAQKDSEKQVNLPAHIMKELNRLETQMQQEDEQTSVLSMATPSAGGEWMKMGAGTVLLQQPNKGRNIFDDARDHIKAMVEGDPFRRFLKAEPQWSQVDGQFLHDVSRGQEEAVTQPAPYEVHRAPNSPTQFNGSRSSKNLSGIEALPKNVFRLRDIASGQMLFTLKPANRTQELEWEDALDEKNKISEMLAVQEMCTRERDNFEEKLREMENDREALLKSLKAHQRQVVELQEELQGEKNVRKQCQKQLWDMLRAHRDSSSHGNFARGSSAPLGYLKEDNKIEPQESDMTSSSNKMQAVTMPMILGQLLEELGVAMQDMISRERKALADAAETIKGRDELLRKRVGEVENQYLKEMKKQETDFNVLLEAARMEGGINSSSTVTTLEKQLREEKQKKIALKGEVIGLRGRLKYYEQSLANQSVPEHQEDAHDVIECERKQESDSRDETRKSTILIQDNQKRERIGKIGGSSSENSADGLGHNGEGGESSDHDEYRYVRFTEEGSLGMVLMDGIINHKCIIVCAFEKGSDGAPRQAEKSNEISVGDCIMSINGNPTASMSFAECVETLSNERPVILAVNQNNGMGMNLLRARFEASLLPETSQSPKGMEATMSDIVGSVPSSLSSLLASSTSGMFRRPTRTGSNPPPTLDGQI